MKISKIDIAIVVATSIFSFSSLVSAATISRTLSYGSTGTDVRALQIFLNSHGFTVTNSGPGSPGQETAYFGRATQRALKNFQEQYRAELITNAGLTSASGILGPLTQSMISQFIDGKSFISLTSVANIPASMPYVPHPAPVKAPAATHPAPVITSNTPSIIPYNNGVANFSITTDILAFCTYDDVPGKVYGTQAYAFQGGYGLTPTVQIPVTSGKTYTFYVRCQSTDATAIDDAVNDTDTPITFKVASVSQFNNNLSVSVYNQAGTVTSSDGLINCGANGGICASSYASPTSVTLTETPSTAFFNFVFDHWDAPTGSSCKGSTSQTCIITVDGNIGVSAWFIRAGAGLDQSAKSGDPVNFDASKSIIPTGASVTYSWDFGDSTTGSGSSVIHTYSTPVTKIFTATLTVKDTATNVTSSDTSNITVNATPVTVDDMEAPNMIVSSPAPYSTQSTNQVTISGTASDPSNISNVTISDWTGPFTPNPMTVTADTSDGFAHWSKTITLSPGKSYIQVRAYDASPRQNYINSTVPITAPD